ncbi:hypothetical protein LIN78_10075 [Leeia sp. TBRC 13508]|uniref:carbonic anhydrase n=1 Tax=Leeia speluncae TaxID=2884804 RepID=A0ABS8D6R5_9NEIS|nr:surface-adhesin E family protein [Leeia speluncae]MCB6183890.1 hypothetical protein [Leeia speluncae]
MLRRFILASLLFTSFSANAAWKAIYSNNEMTLYLDEATQETKGMVAKVWTRERYSRPKQADPGDFFFKTLAIQMQYACDKRTQTPLLSVYYDLADQEIKRQNGDDKAQPIVPGSVDEKRFNVACKISPPTPVKEPSTAPAKPATPKKAPAKPATKPPVVAKPKTTAEKPASAAPKIMTLVAPAQGKTELSEEEQLKAIVKNLVNDNTSYMKSHPASFFDPIKEGQYPRATVVTCADSRVQSTAFDQTPEGDLFTVRNIGNQFFSNQGSIEYGVHHLKTPLLIFVGHSACGAVKAAMGDYSSESNAIKKELNSLTIDKKNDITQNVVFNVHNQVKAAKNVFSEEVKKKELTILGAVFDFRDDLKKGIGKLTIVNFNGETDAKKVDKLLSALTSEKAAPKKTTKK